MDQIPSFLDFEASSLSDKSYPIEVAWNLSDGSIESHMISPADVADWTDWNPESEKIHAIPRAELLAKGKEPSWVCRRMNQQLANKIVYSDAPSFDGMWLERLFSTIGIESQFQLGNAYDLLINLISPEIAGRAYGVIKLEAIKLEARQRVLNQHRAAWDVEYLIELWKLASWSSKTNP